MKKMTNNFRLKEVLFKHPELKEMIEKVYGEITSIEDDPIFEVSKDGKNSMIVVCDSTFLAISDFGFDMDRFHRFLGISDLTSVILVNPEIDNEPGFDKEFSSFKEISFQEMDESESGKTKVVFITRRIPLKRNDFYESHEPSTR